MNIAESIKFFRKKKGESQKQVALALKISQRLYSFYETGKVRFSVDLLVQLANYWNITLDELVGRQDKAA